MYMDSPDSFRRVRRYVATESTDDRSAQRETDDKHEDEISRAYRVLRLVRITVVIVATVLTIARMLGWL